MKKENRISRGCAGLRPALLAPVAAVCGLSGWLHAEVNPYVGLWVGSAGLTTVTEVSIPLDENNVAVAPDPEKPTVTSDRADIRLILHVNDAGQVSLLKDVAIVNRNPSGSSSTTVAEIAAAGSSESSLSLVTDPSLYAEYPMQKAVRYSSVVFDFGDAQATAVLEALVDRVVAYATSLVERQANSAIDTAAERNQIVADAAAAAQGWQSSAAANANDDVAASYQAFLDDLKNAAAVPGIAASTSLSTGLAKTWFTTATNLYLASSYGDTRAMDLVRAVQAAGTANNLQDAWNAAAHLADTENIVARLLSGRIAGEALAAAAAYAATSTNDPTLYAVLRNLPTSADLIAAALVSNPWSDSDSRAADAVSNMFMRVAAAAGGTVAEITAAGQSALSETLAKYPPNRNTPTTGYTEFVASAEYATAAETAATAAVAAALIERVQNPLTYEHTIPSIAKAAAVNALQSVYSAAARVKQNELPMEGTFALGNGDPRFAIDVETGDVLGAPGLTGTIVLPANHATNPFRHRRHPDHTAGFDVVRNIRFDFDADGGTIPSVTRGVSTVGGLYREEVFGLHKVLGPNQDIGLRTEGRFELNRVSTIGTLNGK